MAGGVAMAADMSVSAAAPTGARSTGFIAGPQSITHSLDTATITQFNSVSCNAGGLHTDNAYLRRFTLGDFGIVTQFDLTSVDIGIEQAFGAGGSQPSSVNVYTIANGAALTYANMNLVASTPITVSDASLTVVNFPVTGSVVNPATDDLVVELFTPDGQTTGNSLFVGSNPNGQTGFDLTEHEKNTMK